MPLSLQSQMFAKLIQLLNLQYTARCADRDAQSLHWSGQVSMEDLIAPSMETGAHLKERQTE